MINPETLQLTKQWDCPGIVFALSRDADRKLLYYGGSDGLLYAAEEGAEKLEPQVFPREHASYLTGLVLAGDQLISAGWDGRLIWWDRETQQARRQVEAHSRWIRRLVLSPDASRLISVGDDMVARVWNAADGQLLHELRGHQPKTPHHFPSMLYAAAFSPSGEQLATADRVGHIVVWDLVSGELLQELDAPLMYTWDPKARIHSIGGIRSLAFSADGRQLAAGGIGQIGNIDHLGALARVEVFQWETGERTLEFPGDGYKGLVERLVFDPQGRWLLAAGGDHAGFLQFIDLQQGKAWHGVKAPMHVHDLAFNANCTRLFAAGHGKLAAWNLE